MFNLIERRSFVGMAITSVIGSRVGAGAVISPIVSNPTLQHRLTSPVGASFPRQDAAMVEEMVRVAHSNLPRVKQLLDAHPALAKAAIDWGFGDWEDALGAASHTGRVEIAELLLARGARPTIFSAAMLGQLDTVKAFVAAMPGCQRIPGPHGITLLSHAKAGGDRAKTILAYLKRLGDADLLPAVVPLDAAQRSAYAGTYVYGTAETENLQVAAVGDTGLSITRPGLPAPRGLKHLGSHEFSPAGAEFVRIRFTVVGDKATKIEVFDPDPLVTATRQA